jgi:uncharacterized C2H2 Zn-finger protein
MKMLYPAKIVDTVIEDRHHRNNVLNCNLCNSVFSKRNNARKHVRKMHAEYLESLGEFSTIS